MDDTNAAKPTREERLAAKLRENLRRRKSQGRELARGPGEADGDPLPKPGLSKPPGVSRPPGLSKPKGRG